MTKRALVAWLFAAAIVVVPIVLFTEALFAGLGANAYINVSWVQKRVFLDVYGGLSPTGAETDGKLPSCFGNLQEATTLAVDHPPSCSPLVRALDASAEKQCDPLVGRQMSVRSLPFTSYHIETTFLAAGRNKTGELINAVSKARALPREQFGMRYAPNYPIFRAKGFPPPDAEMLAYDDPSPQMTAVDCGSYSIIHTDFDPSRVRR